MANLLLYLGLAMALAYFPLTSRPASWPRSIVKTIPLLSFSLAAFASGGSAYLVVGLFLSALGDLGLSHDGDAPFLFGLSAFALAHLLYILHFLGLSEVPVYSVLSRAPVVALLLIGLIVSTEFWLAPHTGHLQWPVRAYVLIIGVMGLTALTLPTGPTTVGAGLFIVSDVVLAINLFRMPDTDSRRLTLGYAVWAFYIAGQALILLGGLSA